jgi:hypothetical protein
MTRVASCPHCGGDIIMMKSGDSPAHTTAPDPDWDALDDKPPAKEQSTAESKPKLVTCNRCKEGNLAWATSKNGKYYLCKADANGQPLRREFHQCR